MRALPRVNISSSITAKCRPLLARTSTPMPPRNASRIPTLPRRKTLRHTTTPHKIIPLAAATTVPAKILAAAGIVAMIAAETVAVIAVAAAVGDAVAGAHAADAIFLHRNMLLRRAASPADMIIAEDNLAVTTTGVRRLRALRRL